MCENIGVLIFHNIDLLLILNDLKKKRCNNMFPGILNIILTTVWMVCNGNIFIFLIFDYSYFLFCLNPTILLTQWTCRIRHQNKLYLFFLFSAYCIHMSTCGIWGSIKLNYLGSRQTTTFRIIHKKTKFLILLLIEMPYTSILISVPDSFFGLFLLLSESLEPS